MSTCSFDIIAKGAGYTLDTSYGKEYYVNGDVKVNKTFAIQMAEKLNVSFLDYLKRFTTTRK